MLQGSLEIYRFFNDIHSAASSSHTSFAPRAARSPSSHRGALPSAVPAACSPPQRPDATRGAESPGERSKRRSVVRRRSAVASRVEVLSRVVDGQHKGLVFTDPMVKLSKRCLGYRGGQNIFRCFHTQVSDRDASQPL